MKFTHTKIAIAIMAMSASGATFAQNFSNLSVGTVTNLSISQTGAGSGRISDGGGVDFHKCCSH